MIWTVCIRYICRVFFSYIHSIFQEGETAMKLVHAPHITQVLSNSLVIGYTHKKKKKDDLSWAAWDTNSSQNFDIRRLSRQNRNLNLWEREHRENLT